MSPLGRRPQSAEDLDRLLQCDRSRCSRRARRPSAGLRAHTRNAASGRGHLPRRSTGCRWRSSSPPRASARCPRRHAPPARSPPELRVGGPPDLPERQRTLRATIDWSYDSSSRRATAVRAAGGVRRRVHDRGGAEHLWRRARVVDGLASLTERAFRDWRARRSAEILDVGDDPGVRAERSDARARLDASPSPCRDFLAFRRGDRAEPDRSRERTQNRSTRWRATTTTSGLPWTGSKPRARTSAVLRVAAALWRFWDLKGHLVEGRRRLESGLQG